MASNLQHEYWQILSGLQGLIVTGQHGEGKHSQVAWEYVG